jgi:hypothetical protein
MYGVICENNKLNKLLCVVRQTVFVCAHLFLVYTDGPIYHALPAGRAGPILSQGTGLGLYRDWLPGQVETN